MKFSIFNPGPDSLRIVSRIHDIHHHLNDQEFSDRYNKSFIIYQGWNDISIFLEDILNAPDTRLMDMQNIKGFGLFTIELPQPRVIFIDKVELLK